MSSSYDSYQYNKTTGFKPGDFKQTSTSTKKKTTPKKSGKLDPNWWKKYPSSNQKQSYDFKKPTAKKPAASKPVTYTAKKKTTPAASSKKYGTKSGGLTPQQQYDKAFKASESRAAARQASADAKATKKANKAAKSGANQQKNTLQQQIDANVAQKYTNTAKLNALLGGVRGDYGKGRDIQLGDVKADLKVLMDQSTSAYNAGLKDVNKGLRDNEKSGSDSSFVNLANRAREKQDLVTQALSQGAGESDVLKTQMQALRNWDANQNEVNRAYHDTLSSHNATLTDLNTGTKNQRTAYEMDANQRRGGIWGDYYSNMSEAYTQLENLDSNNWLLTQENLQTKRNMKEQDALIKWVDKGKDASDYVTKDKTKGKAKYKVPKYTSPYSQKAADYSEKQWNSPGVTTATKQWKGQAANKGTLASSKVWDQQKNRAPIKKPEGATLRKW